MIVKSVAVTVALVLVASASQAQMARTNTTRRSMSLPAGPCHEPEARKALAMGDLDNLGVSRPMRRASPTRLSGVG